MAKFNVTGEQHYGITGQMLEIQRQIRLKSGSPVDPTLVSLALQDIIEGRFKERPEGGITEGGLLSAVISTFTVPATTEKFIAKDKFIVNTGKDAKVKISGLSKNFKKLFLGKTEDPFFGSTIYGRKLEKDSVDRPILTELGGDAAAETTLAELYAMMESQPDGRPGDLLNNSRASIFYIRDVNGMLCAVYVYWVDAGWNVDVFLVENLVKWSADFRVFSRNFSVSRAA